MDLPTQLTPLPGTDDLHVWAPEATGLWGYANCLWIISGDDAALIDTPYDGPMTKAMIAAAGPALGDRVVRTVVNTHANGDHSFGNHLFPEAEIISTEAGLLHQHREPTPNDMHALVHDSAADSPMGWYMRRHFGAFDFTTARVTAPTRTFSGEHAFEVGDRTVQLYEVGPAHHHSDLIARVGDVVCTGDIFFHGDHPPHWAGPLQNIIDACELALSFDPRIVIPGHGRPTNRAGLEQNVEYLGAVQREIRARFEAELTLEDAMDDLMESKFYPHFGMPERLLIVMGLEYAHLRGAPDSPPMLDLSGRAAAWSFARHTSESYAPVGT
ncbi:MBL fold metallo-hydrolase [Streptomyces flavofungini]|uniref:MBL fold metallo-hydrolase n=1 Tax=Streptomyces flavofungini TaxID=68200 RepID=UPI0034DF54AE